jgi:DNA-binding HxlR family transcriptional regulator
MAVLAEKWTLLVVAALVDGPMRTAELRRRVDGVSEKMLIQTLRKLESYRLVSRRSYPEIPPRVEYRLTPLGRSLARLASLFGRWVERNVITLLRAEQVGCDTAATQLAPPHAAIRQRLRQLRRSA